MLATHKSQTQARWPFVTAGLLLIFVGLGGIGGGLGFVIDPSGRIMGLPFTLLNHTPFTTFFIPGLVLLLINGLGSFTAGVLTLYHHRHAGTLILGFGSFLMLWIILQVWWIGATTLIQPIYFTLGAVEFSLGVRVWHLQKYQE